MEVDLAASELTYREAVREALSDELRSDPHVLVLGEDVADAGGVFKTTQGLVEEFGLKRVIDTPISETGFVGAAFGMAITGLRPVVEIMFSDFLGVCHDQISNSMAKYRYMSGGRHSVPVVIRCIGGGGLNFGGQHSQTGESWFRVFPGLKIVAAAHPQDAYTLLRAAVRDDNPVLFFEHKALYTAKAPVDRSAQLPLNKAQVVREGTDVTVVASLAMVSRALEAADSLAKQGVDAEVVNVRSLRPLDIETIAESVRKTNRLMTVEEQPILGGWGSDVIAGVVEEAFDFLDAPPQRVGLPDAPLPFSPVLEAEAIPNAERIAGRVLELMG